MGHSLRFCFSPSAMLLSRIYHRAGETALENHLPAVTFNNTKNLKCFIWTHKFYSLEYRDQKEDRVDMRHYHEVTIFRRHDEWRENLGRGKVIYLRQLHLFLETTTFRSQEKQPESLR